MNSTQQQPIWVQSTTPQHPIPGIPQQPIWIPGMPVHVTPEYTPLPQNSQDNMDHVPSQTPQNHPFIGPNWSTGICGCCGDNGNCGFCCLACCCAGIAQGCLLEDLGMVSNCVCPALCYTAIEGLTGNCVNCLFLTVLRYNLAHKLKRDENCCISFLYSCCCFPCSISQIRKDMIDKGYEFETPKTFIGITSAFMGGIEKGAIPYDKKISQTTTPFNTNGMQGH